MRVMINQTGRGLRVLAVAALAFGLLGTKAVAQEEFVYLVKATDCRVLPDIRIQSGFRLQGLPGIVTALHGVAGCNHITASRPGTNDTHLGLDDYWVDLDRDVAVLRGGSLDGGPGLVQSPTAIPAEKEVEVFGHPAAIPNVWRMDLKIETLALVPLENGVSPAIRRALALRQSPQPWINVLRLNGDLQPGHSGAPILDRRGRVVGIGSGGLAGGTLGIGWAIPLQTVYWVPKSEVAARYNDIAFREPTHVFTHSDPDEPAVTPIVRSQGSGCVTQNMLVDLDRGETSPLQMDGDLFLANIDGVHRVLQPGLMGTAQIASMGQLDFDRVTLPMLQRAGPTNTTLDASRDQRSQIPGGTVLAVRTSGGRLAKVRINESMGSFVSFDWVTYALPSEGASPVAPRIGPCGPEASLACGTGQLPGDAIDHFTVDGISGSDLIVTVQHRFNPAHGAVYLGAQLLDQSGGYVSLGFRPVAASSSGRTQTVVDLGTARARYLLVWLYEANKGESFVCRRFDYRR